MRIADNTSHRLYPLYIHFVLNILQEGQHIALMKHLISASELKLTTNNAQNFVVPEIVTGLTSGATATCVKETSRTSSGNTLLVKNVTGTFSVGETIRGANSNVTATLGTPAVTLGAYDKRYIDIPDAVYGVVRILPFSQASSSSSLTTRSTPSTTPS